MIKKFYFLAFAILAACSSNSKTEKPANDIHFNQAAQIRTDPEGPYPLAPKSRSGNLYNPRIYYTGSGANAFANALILGALNGAFFSTNGSLNELTGSCFYGDPQQSALASPCIHIDVKLLNDLNTPVATTSTNENGEFRFYIPTGKSYFIQVSDQKGRSSMLNKKFGRQSNVSLFLKP